MITNASADFYRCSAVPVPVSWIGNVIAEPGGPVQTVTVAGVLDSGDVLRVHTVHQPAWLRQDSLPDAAMSAAVLHINVSLPEEGPRPEGLVPQMVQAAEEACALVRSWPVAEIEVDGVALPARQWDFAGITTLIAELEPDVRYVAIVAPTVRTPRAVELVTTPEELGVVDGTITTARMTERRDAALARAGRQGPVRLWPSTVLHEDHLRLVGQVG